MCGNNSGGHIMLRRGGGLFLGLTSLSWREASGYSLASCESMQGRLFLGLDLTLLDGVEPDAFILPVLELVALGPIVAHGIRENVTSVKSTALMEFCEERGGGAHRARQNVHALRSSGFRGVL